MHEGSSCAKSALLAKNARSTELQPIFECHAAVLPHTNRLQREHKNYKIDLTDDKKVAQKNSVKKSCRKGPFSTDGSDCIRTGLSRVFDLYQ